VVRGGEAGGGLERGGAGWPGRRMQKVATGATSMRRRARQAVR
jgi:hypothetical protein